METKRIDIDTLVALLVARAKVDRTAPDTDNLLEGWRTDALFQDIDALVIGQHNDPATYAEIGRRVLVEVHDLPEIAALAQLAILRGERLFPISPNREQYLLQIIQKLENIIAALPDSTRKIRCKSLFKYHTGIFYETYGHFDLAAEAQRQAAEEAERFGDRPGVAISYFLEARDRLKEALCTGKPTDAIFSDMEQRFAQLIEGLRGSALEVQWAEGNGPVDMITACVWLNRTHPKWNGWVKTAIAAGNKLGKSWEPILECVRAVDMDYRGELEADKALLASGESNEVNEIKATALLILARHAKQAGKIHETRNIIRRMPEEGTQHVRVIAERMLMSSG